MAEETINQALNQIESRFKALAEKQPGEPAVAAMLLIAEELLRIRQILDIRLKRQP